MTAIDTAPNVSSWNRQTYQRLKLSLSLGLRRQLFVAVCDDLSLRNRLAGRLHGELGATSTSTPTPVQGDPKLVSLNLNLGDPNPLAQVAQWLSHNRHSPSPIPTPAFQILGVERLTRQPPAVQRLFLRRLEATERQLPRLESTLLLWLPRPWFHTIQQSVPEFWQWHTGVFEFEGEPTPLPPVSAARPEASHTSWEEDWRSLRVLDFVKPSREQDQHSSPEAEATLANLIISLKPTDPPAPTSPPPSWPVTSQAATDADDLPPASLPLVPSENPTASPTELKFGEAEPGLAAPLDTESARNPEPPPSDPRLADAVDVEASRVEDEAAPAVNRLPFTQEEPLASPVDAYLQLGNHYRQAIEQGDASQENLAIAIQAYEQALQWLDDASPQASDVLNDLGNLYWMLSRLSQSEPALAYLEQGIQAYQLALTRLVAEAAPHTYAMVQNNLGAAYGDLARYKDPADNLEQSIRAYEEALRYRPRELEPIKYASTQNNLGTAHWHLAQQQSPVPNLQAAIAAYEEALTYYNPESEPVNWAMIQNNLGTAYWNLAQYEQPETWLQRALVAYQEALVFRTPDTAPAASAATQNNLGTAYWHLADRSEELPQRLNYLQGCIAAYGQAIALAQQLAQTTPPIPVNFDVFATRNNLGLAHYQLATEPQFLLSAAAKSTHLECALHHHLQACLGVAPESDAYKTALSYLIKTIRAFYQENGITGQNLALSKVPGQLLPEILPRL